MPGLPDSGDRIVTGCDSLFARKFPQLPKRLKLLVDGYRTDVSTADAFVLLSCLDVTVQLSPTKGRDRRAAPEDSLEMVEVLLFSVESSFVP